MLFNSLPFLVFLPVFCALYFGTHGRLRLFVCLAGSYFFYSCWDVRFLSLIILSTVVDYSIGLALQTTEAESRRRALLVLSLTVNLGLLAIFKYFGFFVESFVAMASAVGWQVSGPTIDILLPVGISFYTFQTLSYSIDVYQRKIPVERDWLVFATFVAFFPQLVAGPIVRASTLLPQLHIDQPFRWSAFLSGGQLMILGLFKKIVIADAAAPIVDVIFANPENHTSLTLLVGVYLYAFQIYCDFSGYSDVAIGVGRILGFDFGLNFRRPYFAISFSDFWTRWHVSLSSWLRDYLYIPLGGNRHGTFNTYRNLTLTMLLGGLWHGAAWTFVVWGALHGVYLVFQRLFGAGLVSIAQRLRVPRVIQRVVMMLVVFHLVCLAWIFFRAQTFEQAWAYISGIAALDSFNPMLLPTLPMTARLVLLIITMVLVEALHERFDLGERLGRYPAAQMVCYASLIWGIALLGNFTGQNFIYFQF